MRFLTAGFSHGESYTAILEGLPAGLKIDQQFINAELIRRQLGLGRGTRAKSEHDAATILSGVIDGKTTGSPLVLNIVNTMRDRVSFSVPRPGHADFAGALKYGLCGDLCDLSLIAERASGRETVAAVAAGAVCKLFLKKLGVTLHGSTLSIGGVAYDDLPAVKKLIARLTQEGDTAGGRGEVVISGLIAGIGSCMHRDRRLDGRLAGAVMSIPSVKAVEFGLGCGFETATGSQAADIIHAENRAIKRLSNNAGGIEGGMSNGEDIVVRFAIKPIPTLKKGVQSVDLKTMQPAESPALRGDVCAVESVVCAAEAVCAYEILDEILVSLGGDTVGETVERYKLKKASLFV